MAEGQRVRWWQEQEEPSQLSQRASERVTIPSTLLPETAAAPGAGAVTLTDEIQDTWEELEAEAIRRAEQAKREESESVSFFIDKTSALMRHHREMRPMWWLLTAIVTICVVLPIIIHFADPQHHHSFPNIGAFGGLVAIFIMHHRRQQWLQDHEKPTVRLAPDGLYLHTPMYTDVSLPWNEIEEIKPKGNRKRRCLEIRATKRRRFSIEERDLPISADALAARIAVFETGSIKA